MCFRNKIVKKHEKCRYSQGRSNCKFSIFVMLRDMPTEVYCTGANTLPVKEVWMVSDVYGKIKGIKID